MSTIVSTHLDNVELARPIHAGQTTPVWMMAETWLAALPLMFLVARGNFSFQSVDTNVPGSGVYSSMLAGHATSTAKYNIETFLFYLIMCLLCLSRSRSIIATFARNKWIMALPIFAIATTAWSSVPTRSLSFGVLALINTVFAFYVAERFTRTQQLQLFLGLGVIALLASYMLIAVYPAAGFDHKENVPHAVEGLFEHKNHCAMIMLLLLVPAFYLKPVTRWGRILRGIYLVATILLIIATTSRTGWLLLLITLIFVPVVRLLRRMKPKDRLVAAFLAITASLVVGIVAIAVAADIAVMLGKDPTMSGRTGIWKAVMQPIWKSPIIGYGYNAFWTRQNPEALLTAMSIGSTGLGNAENGILQMWLELGALGLAILGCILAQLVRMSIICFRLEASPYVQWCICMVFLGIVYGALAGDKFMHPNTIEWTILVVVYASMNKSIQEYRWRLGQV
jgi:exopolysaccharide production protein ExoQ